MNLTYPIQKFFLSTMGPTILDIYADAASVKKLVFKEMGIEVPGGATASWSQEFTSTSKRKITALEMTLNEPATDNRDGSYDFDIRVIAKYKTPAYIDNSEYWPHGKSYAKNMPVLDVTAGAFTAANAIIIENAIMDLIAADTGMLGPKSGSVVRARRAYLVTDTDNSDASGFTVTWPDGTTTVFVTAVTFADGQMGIQANSKTTAAYGGAAFNALLKVYHYDTDKYIVTSHNENLQFTLGTGVDCTIDKRYILLDSRFDDIHYSTVVDPNIWNKVNTINLADLTSSDAFAAAVNLHLVTKTGTTVALNVCTTGTNIATVYGVITGYGGINASYDTAGTTIYIATTMAYSDMFIEFPPYSADGATPYTTNASVSYEGTTTGKYSKLTGDDVQRIFANAEHAGELTSAIRKTQTVSASTRYAKFSLIAANQVVGSIIAANHLENYNTQIEFFVPISEIDADIWDGTDIDTPGALHDTLTGAADRTIHELLDVWAS